MENANEPAYPIQPTFDNDGRVAEERYAYEGLTKREKLAMEIYARQITKGTLVASEDQDIRKIALISLRAADIFFEQLNK